MDEDNNIPFRDFPVDAVSATNVPYFLVINAVAYCLTASPD
jgi:hypothetical protein